MASKEVDKHVPLTEDFDKLHDDVFALCTGHLDGWQKFQRADVTFTKITGGISNILLKASPPANSELEPVAVKVFGSKTELFIDRDQEKIIVKDLSADGFGPKGLLFFDNGRIEEFLYCKALTPQEMCSAALVPRIGALLARFHGASVDLPRKDVLWGTIRSWFSTASKLDFSTAKNGGAAAYASLDFAGMMAEIDETEVMCRMASSPVVFGHNDLLSGNVIVIQPHGFDVKTGTGNVNGPLQLIDFEYSSYVARGFDIGNHFNEYAGFECDYSRYPSKEQQATFFEGYTGSSGPLPAEQLGKLSAEANVYALASHIYWGVWAIIQACYSAIDFDYMEYSGMRWREYHRRKAEFFAQARDAFAGAHVPA